MAYKEIDKKGYTTAQVRAALADEKGLSLFDTAAKEYAEGNPTKGVWAVVQAGFGMLADYCTTHAGSLPIKNIDGNSLGEYADVLAGDEGHATI